MFRMKCLWLSFGDIRALCRGYSRGFTQHWLCCHVQPVYAKKNTSMADDLIVVLPRSPGFAEGQLCKDGQLACENAEITL